MFRPGLQDFIYIQNGGTEVECISSRETSWNVFAPLEIEVACQFRQMPLEY